MTGSLSSLRVGRIYSFAILLLTFFIVRSNCNNVRRHEIERMSNDVKQDVTILGKEELLETLNRWGHEFREEIRLLRLENQQLSEQGQEQTKRIRFLEDEVSQLKRHSAINGVKSSNGESALLPPYKAQSALPSAAGGIPTSCQDLFLLGHLHNGYYSVKDTDNKKIKTVYCDFTLTPTDQGFETRIGYNNIKAASSGVYFYVQKNLAFSTVNAVIPFELERLNVGGAMNAATGIFIAPVDGIYHFAFSGIKPPNADQVDIFLMLNNVNIGEAHSHENSNASPYSIEITASLQSTLALKKGDEIKLLLAEGTIFDDDYHLTHFTGWLIQEDLVLP